VSGGHLVRRFVTSLWPAGPRAADEAWVASVLSAAELELWRSLDPADRRHGVVVARRVARDLGPGTTGPVLAAALLHDVGKLQSRLGTTGRVVATLAGLVTGGRRARAWAEATGFRRRLGRYLRHAPLGAEMLEAAGSDHLTVSWAREHHLPAEAWSVPAEVASALKDADGD
jgi:hypothetical protein